VLTDSFGRVATDLRVSLTDRCNLRCTYCMPAEGLSWTPTADMLTSAEIGRLVRLFVSEGVTQVRFTGGEPLLRPDLVDIVRSAASLQPRPRLSMTTNGIGLASVAEALAEAGLDRVNVSLDSLDRERFKELTRRDRLSDVLAGLHAAAATGLRPVKVNAVLMRGVNDVEAPALLRWALDHGYELRFIEQMPLDPQHGWDRSTMVTADEILVLLQESFDLEPDEEPRGSNPAETWRVEGGRVGVIGSVTRPFCGDCDRVRLTSDGQVRNCLFAGEESDLRGPMREGASDHDLVQLMRASLQAKKAGHGIDEPTFLQPPRPMAAIGG
jgi:cyclic pyranopterin phosphate synthase